MSANGNKGRFSDRLKKMRRDRARKSKFGKDYDEDERIRKNKVKATVVKTLLLPFTVLVGAINGDNKDKSKGISNKSSQTLKSVNDNYYEQENIYVEETKDLDYNLKEDKINTTNKVKIINTHKRKNVSYKQKEIQEIKSYNDKELAREEKEVKIHKLEKDILDLLKKRFIKNINDLEILQSDLYILSQIDSNSLEYEKCKDNISEVRKLISKVRLLKEKYDYLKDNYDFEYLLGLDDNALVDKIIELRKLCSSSDMASMVDDYKLLDEYKYLYSRIDYLEEKANEYHDYKERKLVELKDRDIDFEKFKDGVINLKRIGESYDDFVNQQNRFLADLEEKVENIDSYEELELRLKGFNQLLGNSFKYMGLLLLSPLRGLLPSIVTETLITKNTLKNLRNNLEWEEMTRIKYEAIDYDSSIRHAIKNVGDMGRLVDNTLDDIVRLKREFNDKFAQYRYRFPEYEDTIRKLNKMENAIIGNKIKLNMTMDRLRKNERVNANKLKRVKKLNESQLETRSVD